MNYEPLADRLPLRARSRIAGDKRHGGGPGRLRWHWIGNATGTRMFWCGCFKGFRVGRKCKFPAGDRYRLGQARIASRKRYRVIRGSRL